MDRLQKWIAIAFLLFSIGFNLWLYRAEPTTTIDPNDNAFQFALINRTNQMWDYADRTCPHNLAFSICHLALLSDHWVPNWAQGYNLPYYYSHVPQILIVGSYRLFHLNISLLQYYHIIIYLLLCFFPLSIFLAFRILKFPWLTAGIAAILASQISTDGLYGIDQASFLWRGWGLSSQLFALIWLPLAIASIVRYVSDSNGKWQMANGKSKEKKLFSIYHLSFIIPPVFFLTAVTAGHLGIGMMAFLAIPVICLSPVVVMITEREKKREVIESLMTGMKQTVLLAVPPLIILSYWIVPAFLNNNFHNTSVWDPVWKFNSFGAKEVVTMLVNGQLFDFSRFPIFTILVFIGLFVTLYSRLSLDSNDGVNTGQKNARSYSSPRLSLDDKAQPFYTLGILFLFYLALFFGRTTWGGLLNLIPGMSEFHGHRFLVGVHLAGLFLAPIGITWLAKKMANGKPALLRGRWQMANKFFKFQIPKLFVDLLICLFVYWILVPQTLSYATYNTTLIQQANDAYKKAKPDFDLLLETLKELEQDHPGRVYAMRGNEGKNFEIASTPYYMQLSTYGIPTVLWLPETWSMNSDTEQFFSEENQSHYRLYNIKYVVTPTTKQPQPFWNLLKETPSWKLYTVETEGYISVGTAPSVVSAKKTDIINLIHLWIQSDYLKKQIFPQLGTSSLLPNFSMIDPVTYQTPDGIQHNLFAENPSYLQGIDPLPLRILSQSQDTDMVFKATVEVASVCPTCVVILKQTYHPNWKVTVNGKKTKPIIVFPFFTAVRIEQPGIYEVVFSYIPKFQLLTL